MDDQLQDTRLPSVMLASFSNTPQHQVVGSVAVPRRHVAQNLQTRTQEHNILILVIQHFESHETLSQISPTVWSPVTRAGSETAELLPGVASALPHRFRPA